jgi:hypothetical protein
MKTNVERRGEGDFSDACIIEGDYQMQRRRGRFN